MKCSQSQVKTGFSLRTFVNKSFNNSALTVRAQAATVAGNDTESQLQYPLLRFRKLKIVRTLARLLSSTHSLTPTPWLHLLPKWPTDQTRKSENVSWPFASTQRNWNRRCRVITHTRHRHTLSIQTLIWIFYINVLCEVNCLLSRGYVQYTLARNAAHVAMLSLHIWVCT